MGVGSRASGTSWRRWEELHALASEPTEQHVLLAEQVEDATNGLLSTLSSSALCSAADPGETVLPGDERHCPCGTGCGVGRCS